MGMEILKAGMLTTVQDLGRTGYQKFGMIKGGAMDPLALRIANLLVGNEEHAATLEMTLFGASILFQQEAVIAISGGDMSPTIDGKPVRAYRSIWVKEGSVLKIGQAKQGCRTYVALAGGIEVPEVMHSSSTYLRAGIGGYQGRALEKNDILHLKQATSCNKGLWNRLRQRNTSFQESNWVVNSQLKSRWSTASSIRVFAGREFHWFTKESHETVFSKPFWISTESDRMGYRLDGPTLKLDYTADLLSEAVTFGTIQVPADGKPIILMADRQTTGGYAKMLQIATVDLPKAAQLKPGDELTFQKIEHQEAEQLFLEREQELKALERAIELKAKE